jgi:hypothetical protein
LAAADEEEEEEAPEIQMGDDVADRTKKRRGTVVKRTKTLLHIKLDDGTESWVSPKAVEKVPKLNLAPAIEIMKEHLELQEVFAPADGVREGDEVMLRRSQNRGNVAEVKDGECLVIKEDGSQQWVKLDELDQVLEKADNISEGEQVVYARHGKRAQCKSRTDTEILLLHDDGTEEWHEIAEVGRAKSKSRLLSMATSSALGEVDLDATSEAEAPAIDEAPSKTEAADAVSYTADVQKEKSVPPALKASSSEPALPRQVGSSEETNVASPSGRVDIIEFDGKIKKYSERYKRENEALRHENRRLKALMLEKKQGDKVASQNDQLRKELDGKKRSGPVVD